MEELFSLLNFLEPERFPSEQTFMTEFGDLKTEEQVTGANQSSAVNMKDNISKPPISYLVNNIALCIYQVQKLQGILKPMMLRRLKEDVEKNLAPKEETIIEVKDLPSKSFLL